jgi:rare lipoprotein A
MFRRLICSAAVGAAFVFAVPAQANQVGVASFYKSGKLTANGEHFNPYGMTAAHKSLKFGTKVRVTDLRTGRSIVVRINDRGPFIKGRIIDLSLGAAQALGIQHKGVTKVKVVTID